MQKSNYEIMRDQMQEQFLQYDQSSMIRKFNLHADETYLYIRFWGRNYRIVRNTGVVEWLSDGIIIPGNYNESMSIYDVLCCSKPDCHLAGNFMPSSSLKGIVHTGFKVGGGSMFRKAADDFDAVSPEQLASACEALGGKPEGRGDVAYRLQMFDFLPVLFSFWKSDEDFPSEINLLFDENILSYMHYETIWFAAGHLIARLREELTRS